MPVGPDDHTQGPATAVVTLVEYGDFECPHCGRAYPVVKEVQRRMGPRLRFVFRHFPLTEIHPHAQHAAEAAEAAGARGSSGRCTTVCSSGSFALEDGDLAEYARDLGLDALRLAREIAAHTYKPQVREDFMGGVKSGVNGTPTFYINGLRYDYTWNEGHPHGGAGAGDQLTA